MSKRTRIHPVQFYLNDDEQYILEEKYRLSRMKSKSAFLRKMILYGFVYEVDYSHIRKMNTLLGNISSNLNQITHRINSTNTCLLYTSFISSFLVTFCFTQTSSPLSTKKP